MIIGTLSLLLCLIGLSTSQRPFDSCKYFRVSDQTTLTLPSGSSAFTSFASSNYSYPVPTSTIGKRVSLAFSGYEMTSYILVGFDATWQASGTQVTINFQVFTNVTFTLVKYNILVVDQSYQMLSLISGSNSLPIKPIIA